jgi:hypothetical protein
MRRVVVWLVLPLVMAGSRGVFAQAGRDASVIWA